MPLVTHEASALERETEDEVEERKAYLSKNSYRSLAHICMHGKQINMHAWASSQRSKTSCSNLKAPAGQGSSRRSKMKSSSRNKLETAGRDEGREGRNLIIVLAVVLTLLEQAKVALIYKRQRGPGS